MDFTKGIKNMQVLIDNAIAYRKHLRDAFNLRARPLFRRWQKRWLSSKAKKLSTKLEEILPKSNRVVNVLVKWWKAWTAWLV